MNDKYVYQKHYYGIINIYCRIINCNKSVYEYQSLNLTLTGCFFIIEDNVNLSFKKPQGNFASLRVL